MYIIKRLKWTLSRLKIAEFIMASTIIAGISNQITIYPKQ